MRSKGRNTSTRSKKQTESNGVERLDDDYDSSSTEYSPDSENSDEDFIPMTPKTKASSSKLRSKALSQKNASSPSREDGSSVEESPANRRKGRSKGSLKATKQEKRAETVEMLFGLFDTDKNGVVTLDDVERMVDECGMDLSHDAVQKMVRHYSDSSNVLLLEDFVAIAEDVKL